uniref:Uncharacterized protein n=1 Tax=Schistocephalus solidus TaxID=70667 RepID=A0A0X3PTT0_SCHSO
MDMGVNSNCSCINLEMRSTFSLVIGTDDVGILHANRALSVKVTYWRKAFSDIVASKFYLFANFSRRHAEFRLTYRLTRRGSLHVEDSLPGVNSGWREWCVMFGAVPAELNKISVSLWSTNSCISSPL